MAVGVLLGCAGAAAIPLRSLSAEASAGHGPGGSAAEAPAAAADAGLPGTAGPGGRSGTPPSGPRRRADGEPPGLRDGAAPRSEASEHGALLVEIPRAIEMTARPGRGAVVGTVPARSRYYGAPTLAWIQRVARGGRYGRLSVPYAGSGGAGWIPLDGLRQRRTSIAVHVSLSRHRIEVLRRGHVVIRAAAATGAASSPTPRGRYFVTDRVSLDPGGDLGRFALGLSGVQPRPPAGWTGGDQLAIHGTSDPSSIGRAESAGCIRVSDATLARLRRIVGLGTPVLIGR